MLPGGPTQRRAARLIEAKVAAEIGDDFANPVPFTPRPRVPIVRTDPAVPTRKSVPFGRPGGETQDDTDHRIAMAVASDIVGHAVGLGPGLAEVPEPDDHPSRSARNADTELPHSQLLIAETGQDNTTPSAEPEHGGSANGAGRDSKAAGYRPGLDDLRRVAPEAGWTREDWRAQQARIDRTRAVAQVSALPAFRTRMPDADAGGEYLAFDGTRMMHVRDGRVLRAWPAISGKDGHHGKDDQALKDKGPIPEGAWMLKQDRHQSISDLGFLDRAVNYSFLRGKWPGDVISWGENRVWISGPDGEANPRILGRDGFSIHGGWRPGSSGCIDLTDYMADFTAWFRHGARDLPLFVSYPAARQ